MVYLAPLNNNDFYLGGKMKVKQIVAVACAAVMLTACGSSAANNNNNNDNNNKVAVTESQKPKA